jgi:hypothetical protein
MRATRVTAVSFALFASTLAGPSELTEQSLDVVITGQSVRLNGVELRSGPRAGTVRYLSLQAAKKVLGSPQDIYLAGLGVTVFAWTDVGIHLQRGFRGQDKGKLFKFQLFLDDTYDKNEDKHSGKFTGHARVESVNITPETTFDSIRPELEKLGFIITEHPDVIEAAKAQLRILTFGTTNKIERVEAWCP